MAKAGFFKDMKFDLSLNGPALFRQAKRTLNEPREKSSVRRAVRRLSVCVRVTGAGGRRRHTLI